MPHGFVAYIDEAGDDGLGNFRAPGTPGQSHWFVIGACLVSAENDRRLPAWRDTIRGALGSNRRRGIHFRELNHDQRVFAVRTMAELPVGAIAVLSNKLTLPKHPSYRAFKQKNHLYKYLLRYLLERASDICKRRHARTPCGDGRVKLIFSRRGGMDYGDFRNYMRHLRALQRADGSYYPIHWDYIDIDAIKAVDHPNYAGLQLADIVASAFYQGVEPNPYDGFEHRYAQELRPVVVRSAEGRLLNYGLKPVPNLAEMELRAEQREFFDFWKEKAAGPRPLIHRRT